MHVEKWAKSHVFTGEQGCPWTAEQITSARGSGFAWLIAGTNGVSEDLDLTLSVIQLLGWKIDIPDDVASSALLALDMKIVSFVPPFPA
jgi:hypothetical protein